MVLGILTVVEVVGEYGVLVALCVCYGLVFYIHFLGCLVSYVLGMDVCIGYGMLVYKIVF